MKIGVVTDASCDLPSEFLRKYDIDVLPMTIQIGSDRLIDTRDTAQTLQFYADHLPERGLQADTWPITANEIRDRLLRQIVPRYDYVFCITASATRSAMFEHATKASFAILSEYSAARAAKGLSERFALRVVDSKNMFSGTAVLVAEAARLSRSGMHPNDVRKRLDDLRENICGYMVPRDLYYIRNRGAAKGEKSVGFLAYALGSALDIKPVILSYRGETQAVAKRRSFERAVERMFDHVAKQLEIGIDTRHVAVSYGGNPAELDTMPGYERLLDAANKAGIEVLTSVMSLTAAVNVGPGCVAVAYGGELRAFGP